jgi:AcrR family transcriptional regulator
MAQSVNMRVMEKTGKETARPNKRNRKPAIVSAAEMLLRERGISGVTTRAIADAVPCSEGAIYVHFNDRFELLLAVLHENLPEMLVPLRALEGKVGRGTPRQNLAVALRGLMKFHDHVTPMLCSLMTDPELLNRFRQSLGANNKGPHRGIATLAHYIEQEQHHQRVAAHVDAKTAAFVLMASSFFHIFTARLLGSAGRFEVKRLIDFAIQSSDTDLIEGHR